MCVHACVCVGVSLIVVLIVMVCTNLIISGGFGNLVENGSQNMHMQ